MVVLAGFGVLSRFRIDDWQFVGGCSPLAGCTVLLVDELRPMIWQSINSCGSIRVLISNNRKAGRDDSCELVVRVDGGRTLCAGIGGCSKSESGSKSGGGGQVDGAAGEPVIGTALPPVLRLWNREFFCRSIRCLR